MQYNPSAGSDSDAGKKRSARVATGRGRPPARRAATKRKKSESEETPATSDEDSDVWMTNFIIHIQLVVNLQYFFSQNCILILIGCTEKEERNPSRSWSRKAGSRTQPS